jgi:hypothetical protein
MNKVKAVRLVEEINLLKAEIDALKTLHKENESLPRRLKKASSDYKL